MAHKKQGGSSPPNFFQWLLIPPWDPRNQNLPGTGKVKPPDVGASLVSGLASGLTNAAKAIGRSIWKGLGSHAWEWVIGAAMLFVLIGSARRVASGGRD